MFCIQGAGHFHVDTRIRSLKGGVLVIGCKTMHGKLLDRIPVTDHKAFKTPFLAQYLFHQEFVAGAGNAVQIAEGRHKCGNARIQGGFEWRQIHIA